MAIPASKSSSASALNATFLGSGVPAKKPLDGAAESEDLLSGNIAVCASTVKSTGGYESNILKYRLGLQASPS